jgi:type I restriction enzyme M protein
MAAAIGSWADRGAAPVASKRASRASLDQRRRPATSSGGGSSQWATARRNSLIRAMVKIVDPKIGETIYDGACGSAGFLCEAWEYMRHPGMSAADYDIPAPPGWSGCL